MGCSFLDLLWNIYIFCKICDWLSFKVPFSLCVEKRQIVLKSPGLLVHQSLRWRCCSRFSTFVKHIAWFCTAVGFICIKCEKAQQSRRETHLQWSFLVAQRGQNGRTELNWSIDGFVAFFGFLLYYFGGAGSAGHKSWSVITRWRRMLRHLHISHAYKEVPKPKREHQPKPKPNPKPKEFKSLSGSWKERIAPWPNTK